MACRRPLHRSGFLLLLGARRLMFTLEHGNSWHYEASLMNKRTFGNDTVKTEARNFVSCPWDHSRLIIHIARGKGYLSWESAITLIASQVSKFQVLSHVSRVTRPASQTQLSIVFHRKELGCWFSMWLSGIVIVVLAGENAFSFHHEILPWINLVTLLMKDLRLVCCGEQANGSGFEGLEQWNERLLAGRRRRWCRPRGYGTRATNWRRNQQFSWLSGRGFLSFIRAWNLEKNYWYSRNRHASICKQCGSRWRRAKGGFHAAETSFET